MIQSLDYLCCILIKPKFQNNSSHMVRLRGFILLWEVGGRGLLEGGGLIRRGLVKIFWLRGEAY
jgi:hypothetical protein